MRAFSSGAVALTGVEAISNGVPAFRKPESKNAATHPRVDGRHPRRLRSSASRCWPTACSRRCQRGRDDPVDHRRGGVRRRLGHLLRAPGRHRRHPPARRQHRLRRLPADRLDPRPRRLPAPPAPQPRRPARVLQRHHRPGRRGRPADRRLRRRHHRPDPALRRRRVLRLHALPVRHGAAPPAAARSRAGGGGYVINGVGADRHRRRARSSSWSRSSPSAPGSPSC